MKPILFAENSTVFTSNGIGRLSDAVSCYVSEERNGAYELEMVYPSSGAHYSDISIRSIIVVRPYIGANLQAFRVYQITKPINGQVVVKAQHISYDLSKNTAMPFSERSGNLPFYFLDKCADPGLLFTDGSGHDQITAWRRRRIDP